MSATLYVITCTEVATVGGVTTIRPTSVRVAIGVKFTPAGWLLNVTVLNPDAGDETVGVT